MAFAQRKDLGVRTAGEKAQKPDEFLTRSQLVPGTNITFDYLGNWDIKINALTGGGGGDGVDCCKRIISGELLFTWQESYDENDAMFNQYALSKNSSGNDYYHVGVDNLATTDLITTGKISKQRWFNTLVYTDIVHNWGLADPNNFLFSIIDLRDGITGIGSYNFIPKLVGINENTVRIWVGLLPFGTFTSAGWQNWSAGGSSTYKLGNTANVINGGFSEEPITCRFTLQEGGNEA